MYSGPVKLALQIFAIFCATLIAVWSQMVLLGIAFSLFGIATIISGIVPVRSELPLWWRFSKQSSRLLSIGILLYLFWRSSSLDVVHAAIPWLGALVLMLDAWKNGMAHKSRWLILAAVWSVAGALLLILLSYLHNHSIFFHLGLLLLVLMCIACKKCFRLPDWSIQVVNTVLLAAVLLPIVDRFFGIGTKAGAEVNLAEKPYAYSAMGRKSTNFRDWWMFYMQQMHGMGEDIFMRDPEEKLPFALRPGSKGKLFGADIPINSRGFRGAEISEEPNTYRIVTLGESTTFGLNLGTTPWPELLEKKIREELAPGRPVQVINAGVPAFTLEHNVSRLEREILPLKPDMIISYHGINGFGFISSNMPPVQAEPPPRYMPRPLRLLADCEYRLKLTSYTRRVGLTAAKDVQVHGDVMDSKYADLYRELIRFGETNGTRIVLAKFSMAVNQESPPDLVEFYRPIYPAVHGQIKMNALHSKLIERLGEEYPQITIVDTNPGLDGRDENFIDLIHFNKEGEDRMLNAFFDGISNVVKLDLAQTGTAARANP